jgi:heptosyltransferase-2
MPANILVVRLSSLGDVVLTAPVYRHLKARWPDCRITVLVKPAFASALEGNPNIDRVVRFTTLRGAVELARRGGFTHLLDLHGNLRSRVIRALSGIPAVSAYRKDAWARRLFVAFGLRSPALERHTVERYLDALRPWGIAASGSSLSLGEVSSAPSPSAAKNILLIQSAFLGDTVLTLPLARDLKAALPDARLTVLTLPSLVSIFQGAPGVDEVLVDDKRGAHGGLKGPWTLAEVLKARRFDLAVIPHRSFRSALLAYLAGIPRRVGFSSSAGRWLLTDRVPFTWLMHDLERNLALLKPLAPGVRLREDEGLYLTAAPAARAAMDRRLAEAGIPAGAAVVGVHPGSAWPTKRWLPERFAELCRRFEANGERVVLVGGPSDQDLCARVAADSGALNWAGATTIDDLKALLPRMSLFVTNDSGPMHLATGSGVPTLALFGPTTRELGFFPYGAGHRVLEADLPCRPCGLHGARECPEGHFLCMRLITTEQAWAAAREMLERAKAAAAA